MTPHDCTLLDEPEQRGGPRHPGRPMAEFAEEFLERYARHWKPNTLESSAHALRKHILPALGHLAVDEVAVEHVRDWFASMADRPGTANRSMPVLSVMMRMAELWGYRPHNSNPCRNTRRYKTKPMERFPTADEMARLNAVLTRDEFHCPREVAIIRLLLLTGCRYGEVVNLQRDWIRDKRILLPDSKPGPRTVWLLKHREGLSVFVDNPQVPMDNDVAERELRGAVIGRRLSFGSDSEDGADFTATMYSVLGTLVLNGIDVLHWLEAWLEACTENGGHPPDDLSPWLPWTMSEERRREFMTPE